MAVQATRLARRLFIARTREYYRLMEIHMQRVASGARRPQARALVPVRAVLALALGSAVLVAGCGDDEAGGAAGDLVQGRLGEMAGTAHSVLVPTGELVVAVSDGQDTIAAREAADGQEHDAPTGTQWVGLDWRFVPGADYDPLQRTLMAAPEARTTIGLRTEDSTVQIGDAPGASGTPTDTRTSGVVYVAVATEEAPVVEIVFEGATSRLDTGTGEVDGDGAAALAALAPPEAAICPPLRAPRGRAEVTCSYVLTRVPYLAGRGWSDDGWLVAQVETRTDSFDLGAATYAVQKVTDASSPDGTFVGSSVVDQRLDSLVTRVVGEGKPRRLEIGRHLSGVRTAGSGPDDASITVSASVDLG